MKSCITTLALAAFALILPAQLCRADDGGTVRPAEAISPTGGNVAPVVKAKHLGNPARPAGAPVQYANYAPPIAPLLSNPIMPASFAYGGGGGDVKGLQCTANKGVGPNCNCPQCRRFRGGGGTWGSVDYMHLWMKGRNIPALATTSPFPGTAIGDAGVLPNATVLFGNGRIGRTRQSAGRVDFGIWLDDCQTHGVGVKFYGIEGDKTNFQASSNGNPILAVPFFNVDINAEDAVEVAYPAFFAGEINHFTSNDLMMGEGYFRMCLDRGFGYRLDALGGYHVIRLDDGLSLNSSTEFLQAGAFPIGTTVDITDAFKARNEMHGGSVGLLGELTQGRWTLKGLAKATVANTHQTVTIAGTTIVDQGAGPVTIPNAGTFAQVSNIGTYERDKITVVPELGLTLGYAINDCWDLTIGYSALYFPNVVLAGDQIDRRVSPSQVNAFPAFTWRETDQWAQALTMGIEWNF